jgi:protein SCO1/2
LAFAISALALLAACNRKAEPLPVLGQVPVFTLTSQKDDSFDSKQLAGHVWVADFIFTTCPGPCPRMSAQMKRVEKELAAKGGTAVRLVSFTVDPDHDTPPVLADYAKRYAADTARWTFLTGTREALHRLSWDSFHLNKVDGSLEHSTRFAVVDGQGRIRAYVGTEEGDPVPQVMAAVAAIQEEAGT